MQELILIGEGNQAYSIWTGGEKIISGEVGSSFSNPLFGINVRVEKLTAVKGTQFSIKKYPRLEVITADVFQGTERVKFLSEKDLPRKETTAGESDFEKTVEESKSASSFASSSSSASITVMPVLFVYIYLFTFHLLVYCHYFLTS